MNRYENLLTRWVKLFVSHPEAITVRVSLSAKTYYINLQGHRADQSKLVGGKAKMFRSLEALLTAVAHKHGERIVFQLLEANVGCKESEPPFSPDLDWTDAKDKDLFTTLSQIVDDVMEPGWSTQHQTVSSDTTQFCIYHVGDIAPDLLTSFSVLFKSIASSRGRKISLNGCEPDQGKAS